MSSFHQTVYRTALLDIKRIAEHEELNPSTLVYLIDQAARAALAVPPTA
jgi:hypothetical protein